MSSSGTSSSSVSACASSPDFLLLNGIAHPQFSSDKRCLKDLCDPSTSSNRHKATVCKTRQKIGKNTQNSNHQKWKNRFLSFFVLFLLWAVHCPIITNNVCTHTDTYIDKHTVQKVVARRAQLFGTTPHPSTPSSFVSSLPISLRFVSIRRLFATSQPRLAVGVVLVLPLHVTGSSLLELLHNLRRHCLGNFVRQPGRDPTCAPKKRKQV